jgi:hypothetical protein
MTRDPFYGPGDPNPAFLVNEPLPKSEGGLIEAVKRAVVTGLRDALLGMDLRLEGKKLYIDLEYPMEEAQYPGIWVQFSPTKLSRAGIGHELSLKEGDTWCLIQEWEFTGRITLSLAAIKSLDRDRLADLIIANLAFARSPDLVLTKPEEDTRKYRSLISTLGQNPYVAMTLNTDMIYPGGQDVSPGAPWAGGDNVLVYTDSYAIDALGHFNVKFTHDGIYTLARLDVTNEIYPEQDWPFYDPYRPRPL